ncbi:hypothetical protein DPEC_G00345000 [Dallia pectoralis]|uniref:Uncharacterized protein n=1 Tax=Dallia pectoralis TaxID=75939 RepID=A0ACC2F3T3_DALPE|nr:hypothetical protein DPEC_G00345000 [Dallia pectoralis]
MRIQQRVGPHVAGWYRDTHRLGLDPMSPQRAGSSSPRQTAETSPGVPSTNMYRSGELSARFPGRRGPDPCSRTPRVWRRHCLAVDHSSRGGERREEGIAGERCAAGPGFCILPPLRGSAITERKFGNTFLGTDRCAGGGTSNA